jgi:hypothetical protein
VSTIKLSVLQRDRLAWLDVDGRLTPATVVEDAKSVDSPLHDLFEWDKDKAAARHWTDIARRAISSFRVTVTTETVTYQVPQYVRDPDAGREQGYVNIGTLRRDEAAARQALVNEFNRAAGSLRRALGLAVGLGLEDEVDGILARVTGLRRGLMRDEEEGADQPSAPPPS